MAEPATKAAAPAAELSVAERLARDIDRLLAVVESWEEAPRDTALALKHAIEDFHAAGLRVLLSELRDDPAASDALRRAVQRPEVYTLLRRLELLRPAMAEQVDMALAAVRPALQAHGGDVELVAISPPDRVSIRLLGSCDGCGASQTTLTEGVEKSLRQHCDWLVHIDVLAGKSATPAPAEQPVHFISPFAGDRT